MRKVKAADVPARGTPPAQPAPRSATHRAGKVMFLARSLEIGGAERQLVMLARALHQRGRDVVVVVFYPGGALEEDLRAAGVPLRSLDKRGRWDTWAFLARVARLLREERPAVLHGYLDVPNLLAVLLRPLVPGTRVVWGVRASNMDLTRYDWLSRATFRLERVLARRADLVIANSWAGREYRVRSGFPAERIRVIPNGIDVGRFAPAAGAAGRVRAEWGVEDGEALVGMVGRLDPMKDHPSFLHAAARLAARRDGVRFVCVGSGPERYREELVQLARRLGLEDRLIWSGWRSDMPAVYSALDVICSSSAYGEGFANVIGEAMACGAPCVATDVGDSARVVGDTGTVVPPGDPEALAAALDRQLARDPGEVQQQRRQARERIVERYSIEHLVSATEEALWRSD